MIFVNARTIMSEMIENSKPAPEMIANKYAVLLSRSQRCSSQPHVPVEGDRVALAAERRPAIAVGQRVSAQRDDGDGDEGGHVAEEEQRGPVMSAGSRADADQISWNWAFAGAKYCASGLPPYAIWPLPSGFS